MTRPSPRAESRADLAALFQRHGFALSDVPILQPAEQFIELSGEDIRRRLFLVTDAGNADLCLRPEFTIPAARAYLAEGASGRRDYAFLGPVFRQRTDASGEFIQAGLESFGRADSAEADADMLAMAVETQGALGGAPLAIRIGDVGLTTALIAALNLPAGLARKLRQNGLNQNGDAANGGADGLSVYSGVLAALKGADPAEARAFVKDLLSIAGLKAVGGRTPQEIADRFLEKAESAGDGLSAEQSGIVTAFNAISGTPEAVADTVAQLGRSAGLKLDEAVARFAGRNARIAARGIDLARLEAATAFHRNPAYYTGFVFEFVAPGSDKPAIAGGRYDGLMKRLGAASDIPAVGCAIWLERFAGAAQ